MKKLFLTLMCIISTLSIFANRTWIFNDYITGNDHSFIYSNSGTDAMGSYDMYYCISVDLSNGFLVQHHSENDYCDNYYALSVEKLMSINQNNDIPNSEISQVQYQIWYRIISPASNTVNWNNFETFREHKFDEICVSLKVYSDGKVFILFNGDKATSVESINKDSKSIKYYNLNGLEVVNPQEGCLYITSEGKKKIFTY